MDIEKLQRERAVQGHGGVSHPEGWDDIVLELHSKLVKLYPDYRIYQTKEKFGALRYYTDVDQHDDARALIAAAERKSTVTCEVCGKSGERRTQGWHRTLCNKHAKEQK